MHRSARIAAGLVLSFASPLHAGIRELALEDAVRLAQSQSPTARRIGLEERRDDLVHRGARRQTWPDLALDLQAPMLARDFSVGPLPGSGTTTTIVTPDGDTLAVQRQVIGKTTTTRRNALGDLRLQQLLPWRGSLSGGGTLQYRDEDTSPDGVLQPRRDYEIDAALGLELPILGDDPQRRALRRADVEHDMARLRSQAARAQLEFEAVSRYLALLRARLSLDIVRGTAEQAAQALELARRKVGTGLLAEVDMLRMQVNRAEREAGLAEAEAELERAADEFKIFLGLAVSDSLVLTEPLQPFAPQVDVEAAVRAALERRSEIGLAARDLELLEMDRKARHPYWPELGLQMRYGGGASERVLDRALEALSANNLSFVLQLRMPLWDAGRGALEEDAQRAGVALQELELRESRSRVELEVRGAARQLQDALRRFGIYEESSHVADQSQRISAERYERGLIDTSTYLNAQAEAAAARLGRTGALLDLYQARGRLRLVTMDGV